jgi:hypothetical protein
MKMKLMVGAILLLTGFLVGFLPEHSNVRALRQDLEKTDVERAANRSKLVVSHLDDLASMMYLEATRRNYGSAADYSTRFFDNVGQALNTQSDPQLAVVLKDTLALRDTVTSQLAQGNPDVTADIQSTLERLHKASEQELMFPTKQ